MSHQSARAVSWPTPGCPLTEDKTERRREVEVEVVPGPTKSKLAAKKVRRKGQGEGARGPAGNPGRKQVCAIAVAMRVMGAKPAAHSGPYSRE